MNSLKKNVYIILPCLMFSCMCIAQQQDTQLLARNVLMGINQLLGMHTMTTDPHVTRIVDNLQAARNLLNDDLNNLSQAQDLLDKAQNLPGGTTLIEPGEIDAHGHPIRYSVWRMLALVRNGQNPSE